MMASFVRKLFGMKNSPSGYYDMSDTRSGIVLPSSELHLYRVEDGAKGLCTKDLFEKVCSELDIPPCLWPFFALCPETADMSTCLYPHHEIAFPGRYHLRVFVFVKSTYQYIRKLSSKPLALNCYFEQVRRDFLKGAIHPLDNSDNYRDTFKMAALDVWRVALERSQATGAPVDVAHCLRKHPALEFLPPDIVSAVKSSSKWLEYVCQQVPDRIFGGVDRASREKCLQCYLKTYEAIAHPDVYTFWVKVVKDGDAKMEVEVSAQNGIKRRAPNEQDMALLCHLRNALHIEAITTHNLVKLNYKDVHQMKTFLELHFFSSEEMIRFCYVMTNLYQLAVDANCFLVEGGLRPPDRHLRLSPSDPDMLNICHRQICREAVSEYLQDMQEGSYLVRQSRSDPRSLVLNVVVGEELKTFKIDCGRGGGAGFSIFGCPPFPSLASLLQNYEQEPLPTLNTPLKSNHSPRVLQLSDQRVTNTFPIIGELMGPQSPVSGMSEDLFFEFDSLDQSNPSDDIPPLLTIDLHKLSFKGRIGEGHFSQVYKGVLDHQGESRDVAIKVLKEFNQRAWKEMLQEADLMHKVHHAHIVTILGYCADEGTKKCMVVTEYVAEGDLKTFMRRSLERGQPLNTETQIRFANQIALGMSHLTEHNMVHRDLAARNILVSPESVVKITDFGLSRMHSPDKNYYVMKTTNQQQLPLFWYAPECLMTFKFSKHSDVWSFGVLLFELFSHGEDPSSHYHCIPSLQGICQALQEGRRLPRPRNCPDAVHSEIMLKCWAEEPTQRPDFINLAITLSEIREHVLLGREHY